jgi:KDO2-lipid IV(A) lauroyltransferase
MPAYIFLRIIVALLRFVPFPVLYLLSDGLAFLLQRVIGYRKKVVFENLRRSFPEKSDTEIQQIIRGVYRNLTDVTLETIKSYTTDLSEIHRRCQVLNPEIVAEYLDRGESVILAGSHNCNWEYAGLTLPEGLGQRMFGVYKPLTNKVINSYTNEKRSRGGMVLVPMDEVVAVMRKQKNTEACAYMLIADQSPSSRKRAHWVTFFGQETASLPGVDVLARTFDFPVFSYQIRRVRRGFYEIEYAPLWAAPAAAMEGDITRAYTRQLEAEIRAQPENWLWSHKRWKMRRDA